jgi:hypothetical protein
MSPRPQIAVHNHIAGTGPKKFAYLLDHDGFVIAICHTYPGREKAVGWRL